MFRLLLPLVCLLIVACTPADNADPTPIPATLTSVATDVSLPTATATATATMTLTPSPTVPTATVTPTVPTATFTRNAPAWTPTPTGFWATPTIEVLTVVYLTNNNTFNVNVRTCPGLDCPIYREGGIPLQVGPGESFRICWSERYGTYEDGLYWVQMLDVGLWVAGKYFDIQPLVGGSESCD